MNGRVVDDVQCQGWASERLGRALFQAGDVQEGVVAVKEACKRAGNPLRKTLDPKSEPFTKFALFDSTLVLNVIFHGISPHGSTAPP